MTASATWVKRPSLHWATNPLLLRDLPTLAVGKSRAMPTRTRNLEREAKFLADLDFPLPDFKGVKGVEILPEQELNTAYFDTQDHRLWRQGISLRHRVGETEPGEWTVKLPRGAAASTLDRTELSWPGDRGDVPAEARQLLQGLVRRGNLGQIAEMATARRRRLLHDTDGVVRAELDDDTVTVIGGPRDGLRFRQIEVEMKTGDASWIDALLAELRQAGASVDDGPKLAKALDLPVQPSANADVHRGASIGDVVRASLANGLNRLLAHDVPLRVEPWEPAPEDIHQARVATRRLRSDLKTFRSLLDPVWVAHTRAELRWLGKLLGHVRDLDVLEAGLSLDETDERSVVASTGFDELSHRLAAERLTASEELARAMSASRYEDLVDRLHAALHQPPYFGLPAPTSPARRVLPKLVRRPWRVLDRRVRNAGRNPTDWELHRIRIGAKQLQICSRSRFAGDGHACHADGQGCREAANGAWQPSRCCGGRGVVAASGKGWTAGFSLRFGLLTTEQRRRQEDLRRQWPSVWGQLAHKGLSTWR